MECAIGSRSCAAAAGFSGRQASHPQPQPVSACSRPAKKCRQLSRKTEITCKAGVEGQLVHSRFPGYFDDDDSQQSPSIVTPDSNSWGLSVSQMKAMGITNESAVGRTPLDPVSPGLLWQVPGPHWAAKLRPAQVCHSPAGIVARCELLWRLEGGGQ